MLNSPERTSLIGAGASASRLLVTGEARNRTDRLYDEALLMTTGQADGVQRGVFDFVVRT